MSHPKPAAEWPSPADKAHAVEQASQLHDHTVKGGLRVAAARARGRVLGRQPGQRPKSDRLAPKVLALVEAGRSYRLIARELGLSKNTVVAIVQRHRAHETEIAS